MIDILVRVLLMPPMSLIVLMLAGHMLRRRWPRGGRAVSATGLAALLVLSTNAGALLLVRPLENLSTPLSEGNTSASISAGTGASISASATAIAGASGAQAIVVLAAGGIHAAPEYGGADIPDEIALVRLRYAARLQHLTGLPLLVSGGNGEPENNIPPKASAMARALREDFRTPVAWTEERSADTTQNAIYSAAMLKAAGVTRVLLVTHAMHMPRAQRAFAAAGLEVVPAPTMFYSRGKLSPLMFVPGWSGMFRSYYAAHEWIGLAWQRLH